MFTKHTIYNGDCREMNEVSDNGVSLIITSPPYWQLKDYGVDNQIGFDDDYESYINNLNIVWKECFRVLKNGCRLCINVGDQFARSVYYGRYKIIPIHSEIIRFCETIGFDYMGKIIWQKTTTMNTTGGGSVMGSYPYPRNGIVKLDYEYILLFKKQGKAPPPSVEQKGKSIMSNEEWNTFFSGHWNFAGVKQDKHLAMFPEELPRRLIRMFSFVGETVLDPFAGSGTTAKVARELGRNSINYEINPDFLPIIKEKVGYISLADNVEISFVNCTSIAADVQKLRAELPYRFSDVHKLNKTTDVKKQLYGSIISKPQGQTVSELFGVKSIISPRLIELSNGTVIRLIGIKPDSTQLENAISFLKYKLSGKRVFLRYDNIKYDDGYQPAYLYLDNKTFINAHLLKHGYALVDTSQPFKYIEKFLSLQKEYKEG